MEGHKCQFLQYHRIVDSIVGVGSPGEGAMGMNKDGRNIVGGLSRKGLDDDITRFLFVLATYLTVCHRTGAWNRAVKIVSVRCAESRDGFSCLRKRGRPARMCVDDASHLAKSLVKLDMCGCI